MRVNGLTNAFAIFECTDLVSAGIVTLFDIDQPHGSGKLRLTVMAPERRRRWLSTDAIGFITRHAFDDRGTLLIDVITVRSTDLWRCASRGDASSARLQCSTPNDVDVGLRWRPDFA